MHCKPICAGLSQCFLMNAFLQHIKFPLHSKAMRLAVGKQDYVRRINLDIVSFMEMW